MFRYFAEQVAFAARERFSEVAGELYFSTIIDIRGNPSKGPVFVKLRYLVFFRRHGNRWPHSARQTRLRGQFQSDADRRCFVRTFYKVDSGPLADSETVHPGLPTLSVDLFPNVRASNGTTSRSRFTWFWIGFSLVAAFAGGLWVSDIVALDQRHELKSAAKASLSTTTLGASRTRNVDKLIRAIDAELQGHGY